MNTYFNPIESTNKKKWKRLLDLDQYNDLLLRDEEYGGNYITHREMDDWRENQYQRMIGSMKTYFHLSDYEEELVKYTFSILGSKVNTPKGRAAVDEILIAIIYIVYFREHGMPIPDFSNAIYDYDIDWYRVYWMVDNKF